MFGGKRTKVWQNILQYSSTIYIRAERNIKLTNKLMNYSSKSTLK